MDPTAKFKRRVRYLKLFLCIVALIIIFIRAGNLPKDDSLLREYIKEKKVRVLGVVNNDPDIKNGTAKFVLEVENVEKITDANEVSHVKAQSPTQQNLEKQSSIQQNPKNQNQNHKLLVKVDTTDVEYGDRVEFFAKLEKPKEIVNPDGRTFDYASYLSKDEIFYTTNVRVQNSSASLQFDNGDSFQIVGRDNGNPVIASLYKFKHSFIKKLDQILPSPHSFLASGLIISGKGSLDKKLQEDFQRVGLIHIVVLSGFNISIIGEAIVRMFSFLPASLGAICGGFGIILFSIMTGGGSTVVRSATMSLIGLYARISGRTNSALTSLIVAGLLMLLWNPRLAIYDPSFQLSFTATLALILYASPIESWLLKLKTKLTKKNIISKDLLALVASTLSTQIFTLPLIVKLSGVVSLIALPVNIVTLPFIPLTMFCVFVTGCLCFILPALAVAPAFVSWILLSYELAIVHLGSSFSLSAISLPPMSIYVISGTYILLLLIGILLYIKSKDSAHKNDTDESKIQFKNELKNTAPI